MVLVRRQMYPVHVRVYHDLIVTLQYVIANPLGTIRSLVPAIFVFIGVVIFLWLLDNIVTAVKTPSLKISTNAGELISKCPICWMPDLDA